MRRIPYKDLLARNSHISYEDLVALVSDEASLEAAERIRKHLGSCWHCQARHQELKQSIIEIVQNLNAYVGDLSSRARIAKCRLDQDLQRLAGEKNHPAPFTQVLEMLESTLPSRLPIRQIAIVAACLLALLAIFPLTSTAPISAAELLQRSKRAEEQMMRGVPDPAIHGTFLVTRKNSGSADEQSMTWEVWEDRVHNRVRNRVEGEQGNPAVGHHTPSAGRYSPDADSSPLLADLQSVCQQNGIDVAHPLSPEGFDNWRRSLRGERDEVFATRLAAGGQGMDLRTTPTQAPAQGQILSAELIVRSGDWHPVEQRFRVQGATTTQEYDVLETAYQVVALESAPTAVFADLSPTILPPPPARRRSLTPAITVPTPNELDEAELSAKFALHAVDEFLRGQIRIAQDPAGSVVIEGIVETDQRRSELTDLLSSIPYVAVRLQTSEEALTGLKALSPEAESTVPPAAGQAFAQPDADEVKRNQAWVQSQWNQYGKQFQSVESSNLDEKMAEISNEAIAHTRAASYQAWALRRLAQDYPPERVSGMSAWSKWLLETMVHDHARLLGAEIAHLNAMVTPVLESFDATGGTGKRVQPVEQLPPLVDDPAWQRRMELLFQNVDDINEQVLGVFGNVDLLRGSAAEAVSDLLIQLPRFDGDVQDFQHQVCAEFKGVGESPALNSSLKTMSK